MQIKHTLIIPEELKGKRFDQALALLLPDYSRSRMKTWIDNGEALLNGKQVAARSKVNEGDEVIIDALLQEEGEWKAENIPLNIVYEDDDILVINKPDGLVVHPAAGNRDGTLVNALLYHCPALKQLPRAGIVHRLDKNTTGLLVIAKTIEAHHHLVKQLQARSMKRQYQAIINGTLISGGTVEANVGRHPTNRLKMAVTHDGKPAVTHYRILEKFHAHTHIELNLETGRTHQIRVHMAHILHPIVGDQTYSRLQFSKGISETLRTAIQHYKHQALHASRLTLEHPTSHEEMFWEADLPEDFQELLQVLKNENH